MAKRSKDKCSHINADLTMCKSTNLYASSINCKKHFADIDCSTRASKIQDKRLKEIREIDRIRKEIDPTIKQLKKGGIFLVE